VITIELPLPHQDEHPNARPHWRAKAKAKKKTRGDAHFMTNIVMVNRGLTYPLENPTYKVEFCLPRKRDEDGLIAWIKAQIDGIADAGLIRNDSELKLHSVEQKSGYGKTGGKFFVRYTIWSLE
jgi:hypothetical protein